MFTLSGAHVFPMYDGAVTADPPMRILDVRHEQTAAFAAEAIGKLTRTPGLAVLTAGPGVTNGVSAIAQAQFSGSPLVVVGGRAPANRWGSGSLQELDQPPIIAPVAKSARTLHTADEVPGGMRRRVHARGVLAPRAGLRRRADGRVLQPRRRRPPRPPAARTRIEPDGDALGEIAELLGQAQRPVLVLGTDVWADGAEGAALRLVEEAGLPADHQRHGPRRRTRRAPAAGDQGSQRGPRPRRPRGRRRHAARLPAGLRRVRRQGRSRPRPASCTSRTPPARSPGTPTSPARPPATSRWCSTGCARRSPRWCAGPTGRRWVGDLQDTVAQAVARDAELLGAEADPIHPARIYGELVPRLADDAIVIGDGGDFVSFAGKYVEPKRPGGWLDPGPYGCLGAGLGAAIAARITRPSAQVVLLYGDGAAGMSLMDVDTLVRHDLPVVMVCGNNSAWGLEKGPMQMLYGYDVAADLAPQTRYDEVVTALGGAGETITDPRQIGPALDRAFAANVPYLVNVITDVDAAYPRATFGI